MTPVAQQLTLLLLAALAVATSGGCRWNSWLRRNANDPPPIAFSALPTREEAVAAINANTSRIQSLQTQGATVSIPGFPAIGAEIALERPKKLRFRAGATLLGGQQLDLGSNDLLFWFWLNHSPEQAVYYARHDQFATSRARQMVPIEPAWLIEILGVVEIDPASIIEGPLAAGDGRIQIKTAINTPQGQFTRLMHLHSKYGWLLEQHLYDERGQLFASARSSQHEYHTLDGVSLARRFEVQVPQNQMRFQLDVGKWIVNQPPLEGAALFDLPREQLASHPFVDIADPNFAPPVGSVPVSTPPRVSQAPASDFRDRYRGFPGQRY